MQRSRFVAAILIVTVLGALVAARIGAGDDAADEELPAADGAITGGEAAVVDADGASVLDLREPPPFLDAKPPLRDLDGWLNTDATSLDDFAGQVRIVEFWTFGCFNCKNRLPHTRQLYADYHPQGLEIIGVHSAEFEYERDIDAIAEATERLEIVWPVAIDNRKTSFIDWQGSRRFWPRVYVLDQNGDVRYDRVGEGDYDGLEETVAYLLENGP